MSLLLRRVVAAAAVASLIVVPFVPSAPPLRERQSHGVRDSILGVHGRMTDEVEKWKIDRTAEMIGSMGANWLVEYFPWAYLEPSQGHFDWTHSDMVVESAVAQGLKVIARLDMVPEWARPPGTSSRYLDEERFADYALFAANFASRYRGAVEDIVVWNEPNLSFEWGYRPVDPISYTRLLRVTYEAVKAANPEVSVMAAGLAPTLERGEWGLNDLVYLQRMYEAGAAAYFDKLAVHAYGWRNPPEDPASPDRVNFARAELLRQIMVANGDEKKKVAITEGGWNDHPRWTKAVSPSQRIQYSLRALNQANTEWPWVESFSFWSFRLPRDAHNYNDYFTFVTVDFAPKPIYRAFQQRAESLRTQASGAARGVR